VAVLLIVAALVRMLALLIPQRYLKSNPASETASTFVCNNYFTILIPTAPPLSAFSRHVTGLQRPARREWPFAHAY
jgi:hypothetical protein